MDRATTLTDRFDRALLYATHFQWVTSPEGDVNSLCRPFAGRIGDDLAIAALLHDSVEDQGGKARRTPSKRSFEGCDSGTLKSRRNNSLIVTSWALQRRRTVPKTSA